MATVRIGTGLVVLCARPLWAALEAHLAADQIRQQAGEQQGYRQQVTRQHR